MKGSFPNFRIPVRVNWNQHFLSPVLKSLEALCFRSTLNKTIGKHSKLFNLHKNGLKYQLTGLQKAVKKKIGALSSLENRIQ